jgi:DNA-directed RNA polymerase alpha subunit
MAEGPEGARGLKLAPIRIENLGLHSATQYYLVRADVIYIDQLERMTDAQILFIRNVGLKRLTEIRSRIQAFKKQGT